MKISAAANIIPSIHNPMYLSGDVGDSGFRLRLPIVHLEHLQLQEVE